MSLLGTTYLGNYLREFGGRQKVVDYSRVASKTTIEKNNHRNKQERNDMTLALIYTVLILTLTPALAAKC